MNLKPLTPHLSVMPQITPADIAELVRSGYRSIISNRPDGESPDQPDWSAIKATATRYGMEARHIPVDAREISRAQVEQFRRALRQLPKPIAAFCRTGTRAVLLWALANEGNLDVDERVRIAAAAGYDLEPLRARLDQGSGSAQ